jgi:hypothetical protein
MDVRYEPTWTYSRRVPAIYTQFDAGCQRFTGSLTVWMVFLTAKIRFLHIPKTAGSTFDECLFLLYLRPYLLRRQFVFSGNIEADRQRFGRLSPAARKRIAICTGHAPRVTGCSEVDAMPTVTLLRHPLERVKSFCRHVSEGKSPRLYSPARDGQFDLDAFLGSDRIQLHNFQCRIVLGEGDYALPAGDPAALATRAMALLESQFSGFGLTEDIDRSLLLFRRQLGWRQWPLYRSRNSSDPQAPLQFEPRHIARIEELNAIDLEFYRLARAEFYRRLQQQCPDLETDLPRFQSALAGSGPRFAVIDMARGLGRVYRSLRHAQAGAARGA